MANQYKREIGSILLFGARGLVGSALMEILADRDVYGLNQEECDLTRPDQVRAVLDEFKPDVVINAAGYTDVDGCESNPTMAQALNQEVPGMLAQATRERNCLLVHLSTDFVFDGNSAQPYREDDPPRPLSIYGRTKLGGEEAVWSKGGEWLIVRSAWVFGHQGRDFVRTIVKAAREDKELRVVNDQIGSPTYTLDLSDGLLRLIETGARGRVHVVNCGQTTWFNLARQALDMVGMGTKVIEPISSKELARPAVRPAYSALDTSRFTELTGHRPRSWKEALRAALEREGLV